MSYVSLAFFTLVIALCVPYYLLPKKWKMQGVVLLIGSLIFYLNFDVRYIFFLLFVVLSTFYAARLVTKTQKPKLWLTLCVVANVAVWFVIKALPFTITVGNQLLGLMTNGNIQITIPNFIVPVGISYFTLQAVAYLVDVYKGKIESEKNLYKYFLFLSYFPAIVQGPISRYSKLAPQLTNPKDFSFEGFRKGLILIVIGFVKKVVIADRVAILVNNGFSQYEELNGLVLYLVAIGYAIQLYMDFSGCVDICRGVSQLFGIELINNFNRPYLATSIKEFWSKWHLSLSSWLKDYIYIPLGGNRKGAVRKYINLLLTFLVSGLWHGAGYNFLVWGAMHAIYQIIEQTTDKARAKLKSFLGVQPGSVSERIYQTLITFNLVTLAWIFFRAPDLAIGWNYVVRMFSELSLNGLGIYELGVDKGYFPLLIMHLITFFAVEHRTKSQDSAVESIVNQHIVIRWVIYLVLVFDVILFGAYGSGYDLSGFLYGGF